MESATDEHDDASWMTFSHLVAVFVEVHMDRQSFVFCCLAFRGQSCSDMLAGI